MHTSIHVAFVPVPQSDRHLIFQTLTGAVDLIPEELVAVLQQSDGLATSLSEPEIETLTRRGYLTDKAPEHEQAQAEAVLRLAAKNLRAGIEIVFRFSPSDHLESDGLAGLEEIDEVFGLAASAAKRDQLVSVALEVATPQVEPPIIERIIGKAAEHDYAIIPIVTPDGLNALRPWRQSQNFPFTVLETNHSTMPADAVGLADCIVGYFERQIHMGWRCNVDQMSDAQLAAVNAVRERVRARYPSFMVWLVSEATDGTAEPAYATANGSRVPYISADNEGVLKTLFRFLTAPRQVNYSPFFQPEGARLVYAVGARQLSYESPAGQSVEGFAAARAAIEQEDQREPLSRWPPRGGIAECLSCKYSLVCGQDWIAAGGYRTSSECAARFERRMHQVLPLLLYNARGNLRPPAATAKNV